MANVQIDDLNNLPSAADTVVFPVDNGIQTYKSSFLQIKNFILGTIPATISGLISKQDREKSIKCIATQRTFNNTAVNGEFSASDESSFVANTDFRRRLNNFSTNSSEYFELLSPGMSSNTIVIKKPGTYIVRFSATLRRSGTFSYCYVNTYEPSTGKFSRVDRPAAASVATGATSAGNTISASGSFEYTLNEGDGVLQVNLWHFSNTKTANNTFGVFTVLANSHSDTCTLEIELIEE